MCLLRTNQTVRRGIYTFDRYIIAMKKAFVLHNGQWTPSHSVKSVSLHQTTNGLITRRHNTLQRVDRYDVKAAQFSAIKMKLGFHMELPRYGQKLSRQIRIGNTELKIFMVKIPVLINPEEIQAIGSEDIVAERFIVPSTGTMKDILRESGIPEKYDIVYRRLVTYYSKTSNNGNNNRKEE